MGRVRRVVRVRRVYDPPAPEEDGVRVLVDRLWPRGLAKAVAGVDEWPKAVTPSGELRKWYHGGGGTAQEFRARYEAELAAPEAVAELDRLRALAADGPITLLTAVKDPASSHAAILSDLLSG
ncbi:DUF488 family protein [Streptomyces sp. NPDC048550]|uniref:DUF488 domain-containing protein n=1 Tax=unclassified Streptomyces TaxID=2593676 RepID=UPI000A751A45|nr:MULTISPECIES: DUF488 family protein [unclassified Streptomyces]MCX5147528.1 DUF488 family protein [Streptomyces sp. NBC_00320]WSN50646.1 DUF488 family protein [Streptomyces sp. NBC_01296]WSW59907.1 DUF488 family protein [Streptomyces sp. NBC_00998]